MTCQRSYSVLLPALLLAALAHPLLSQDPPPGFVRKLGLDLDVRSMGRMLADEIATTGTLILPDTPGGAAASPVVPQIQLRGGNLQVTDAALDNTQIFPSFRPFLHFTQSETSVAAFGRNIVVAYNSSAGMHFVQSGSAVMSDRVYLSGYSRSGDGGATWTSGFFPPLKGSIFTLGDPSIGVDRLGNFYFATLGADAQGRSTIQVNTSRDGGATWSDAVLVQQDNGSDKEWLAVGPDPVSRQRDNVYVTWTSFQATNCELRLGRSIDGGATWTTSIIYSPSADLNAAMPQNCLQSSNPVVDQLTGRLYVPFLQFSNSDADWIRMLISDDAGATFHWAKFNIPGALIADGMPMVQAGHLIECGATRSGPYYFVNLRLSIHAGPNIGGALTGLPRYVNASRLFTQPAVSARDGVVYLAWSASTSPYYGDPLGNSNVFFLRSDDGGATWLSAVQVNAAGTDIQHVLPSLVLDEDPSDVHIAYYTQHADGSIDVDMANSHDRGATFPANRTVRVTSSPGVLPPTNIPIPSAAQPFATTNYDRNIAQCYALGEYLSVTTASGSIYGAWGDTRNTVTEPVNPLDPLSGLTHSQEDVFFQKIMAQ